MTRKDLWNDKSFSDLLPFVSGESFSGQSHAGGGQHHHRSRRRRRIREILPEYWGYVDCFGPPY